MEKEIIATGKTVDEAYNMALEQLGETGDVQFEILETPKKGFLGLGKSSPAKVRVWVNLSKFDQAKGFIKDVLDCMGLEGVRIDAKQDPQGACFSLEGEQMGAVIGRRGETLDAFQYITSLVVNRDEGEFLRITIDSGDYRDKREKTLVALAKRMAQNVIKTGKSATLEPMNPYERRVIHATVSTVAGVTSTSVGDEPNRRVVINPAAAARTPFKTGYQRDDRPPRRFDGDRNEQNRGDRGDRPFNKDRGRGGRPGGGGGRRDVRPANKPQDPATLRKEPPAEASDKPLYSKIDI